MEIALTAAALVGLVAFLASRRATDADHQWPQFADALGLKMTGRRSMAGAVDGFTVRCEEKVSRLSLAWRGVRRLALGVLTEAGADDFIDEQTQDVAAVAHLIVEAPSCSKIAVERRPLSSAAAVDGIKIGDPHFDEEVLLRGAEPQLLAALDQQTRSRLLDFVERGGEIARATVSLSLRGGLASYELANRLPEMIALAKAFSIGGSQGLKVRLAMQSSSDPIAAVRLRCLEILRTQFAADASTREACRVALRDRLAHIRMYAARGVAIDDALAVLVELIADSATSSELRVEALEYLGAADRPAQFEAMLRVALEQWSDVELKTTAIRWVGQRALAGLVPEVLALCDSANEALGVAAAQTLGRFHDSAVESALLSMLESESREVKRAAIGALENVGTVRAVERLMQINQDAAQDAVRAIQSRLGDAGAGRVSIVGASGAAGAVSIASEVGAVSIAAATKSKT